MPYKFLYTFFLLFLFSCVNNNVIDNEKIITQKSFFLNKGFTLVYSHNLFKDKKVGSKIDDRGLIILQKNLKKNTSVKITNLINSKSLIAKVGKNAEYPFFYNSVISKRIKDELELDELHPYIEIKELTQSSSFIVKKSKTYDEEKNVADKAPVDDIQIKNLGESASESKKVKENKFNYIIKIGDFYFKKSAMEMKFRILNETSIKQIKINKLSSTKFRVFIGPYDNLNSLKKSFNAINVLEFDSIEIIKK